ncbi:MAG: 50S ribosomal protein L22 [Chitinophagales bacterium]|nr:50S ribosomal protein L22 [Bacteroidota bacterium]MCB9042848.1 50S ribosomal protein L22 [Chitinophagales bacterium]
MEAIAKLNNCPTSPRKMRLVVDLVRGKNVEQALNILKYTRKHAARDVEKLLISAISNWEVKNARNAQDADLYIAQIKVDGGSMLKRFRPAPFGRPHKIRKRSNHVTIILDSLN